MEPAVPFALLGVVELLAVAGWLGLAGAALFPGLWRRTSPAFVLGAAALAAAEVATVVRFGDPASSAIAYLRAAGLLGLAVGLAGGVLQPRTLRRLAVGPAAGAAPPGVVVPLGAPGAPGVLVGVAGVLAAAGAWYGGFSAEEERDRLVAGGAGAVALLAGAGGFASLGAGRGTALAIAVLGLRGAAALAAFALCARLALRSVLAKVVVAILAGVVVMAAGAVGVVGASVGSAVLADQVQATRQAALAQQQTLATKADEAELRAQLVVACIAKRVNCASLLNAFSDAPGPFFAAEVCGRADPSVGCLPGRPAVLAGSVPAAPLYTLAAEPPVEQALARGAECASFVLPLGTTPPSLAVVGVVPESLTSVGCGQPTIRTSVAAGIYGIRFTDQSAAALAQGGYDLSFLAGGQVIASNLRPAESAAVLAVADRLGPHSLPSAGLTVVSQGNSPTVSFQPIVDSYDGVQVAVLAVSAPSARVVGPERSVLTRLFLAAVLVLLLVALIAVVLGRRIVAPVRRLTIAARRVRRGELDTVTKVPGHDEVAALSRSFDTMTASLRDMTGQLRSAAAAEMDLRIRLQTVVDSMADGLVTTGPDRTVTAVNPAAAALVGEGEATLVGRHLADALPVTDEAGAGLFGPERPRLSADGVLRRGDGRLVPVQVTVSPLGDGAENGVVVLLRDTTRDREVERMKTEFLANVSHELRTPLTPIRGYAELLARKGPGTPGAEGFVEAIHESSLRMQRVVDLLVDVAALEAGRVQPRRQQVPVAAFADECLQRWRVRWPERSADLRRRLASGLPDAEGDPYWLAKALDELADNAVKYTSPGTPITLVAAQPGPGVVRISVRDAGPGIEAERVPELLSDFSQADASETRAAGGMGLGLSFVRRLAEGFGTRLSVRSTVGRGSEFSLDLPAAAPNGRTGPPGPRRRAKTVHAAVEGGRQ